MRTGPPRPSVSSAAFGGAGSSVFALGAGGRAAIVGAARWRVWAPILMRAVALGLALLGLAGIGLVASRSPELAALTSPRIGLDLAGLGSHAVDTVAGGASTAEPAPLVVSTSASLEQEPSALQEPPSASAASTPCPKAAPPSAVEGVHRADAEAGAASGGPGGRIVLNQASAAELVRLPGVGAKRAAAILALRERLGRFRRPSDLLRIKGIGPRTLERMLPHLVVD